MDDLLTLAEAADLLGVHYMTAYRYVRDGRLPATKVAGRWTVAPDDLLALRSSPSRPFLEPRSLDDLVESLIAGDDADAWRNALGVAGEAEPATVIERALVPAMVEVGRRWASGAIGIGAEHRSTATATRLLGRLGELGEPRGRRRGHLVVGAPHGDDHALPVAITAALARHDHFEVTELGADVDPQAFCEAVASLPASGLAVAVVVTCEAGRSGARAASDLLAERFAAVPRLIGGGAISGEQEARALGATVWANDLRQALARLRSEGV